MKHCKKCGAQLADDDTYCYFCGANLEEENTNEEKPVFTNHYEDNYIPRNTESNNLALAGFIVAFFSPIVGLVLSIIGLRKARELNGLGRGHAIAGIVVSILNVVLTFILYSFYISMYNGEV